jgi:hypothetical protein
VFRAFVVNAAKSGALIAASHKEKGRQSFDHRPSVLPTFQF